MPDVRLTTGDGDTVRRHFKPLNDLYVETFSQPPFVWPADGAHRHEEALTTLMREPNFQVVLAYEGEQLVGFAYGHRLPTDHRWWTGVDRPLPREITAEREGRTFALIDFAVSTSRRRQGIGRSLLSTLLRTRPEERTILTVQPTAVETQAFYLHLGWQHLGRKGPFADTEPPFWDLYLLDHDTLHHQPS